MEYTIKEIELTKFKYIYDRIEQDFASGEYAPYEVLYKELERGVQKGLILLKGETEVAYSIIAEDRTIDYVLITLFAVYKEYRGKGIGSAFIKELMNQYTYMNGIIVEVEKPEEAENSDEEMICRKRIQFYQRSGFYLLPHIDYVIWDIPMYLMVLPCKTSLMAINNSIEKIMSEIYINILGKRFIHKLKIKSHT